MPSRVDRPALKGTLLGKLLALLNPVVRLLLASPIHWPLSGWFALLAWTGTSSGRERSTPVSFVQDATGTYVTTGDRWPDYVVGNPTLRIRIRGRWRPARAQLIADPDACRREHERLCAEHGWFRVLAGIPKRGDRPDEAALARAIAAGRKLVKIEID